MEFPLILFLSFLKSAYRVHSIIDTSIWFSVISFSSLAIIVSNLAKSEYSFAEFSSP
jgi:hypothetical protein